MRLAAKPDPLGERLAPGRGAGRSALSRPNRIRRDMRRAPGVFESSERLIWDGKPTLSGLWIAHPRAAVARRVRLTNAETGTQVDAALLPRRSPLPGAGTLISSEAADALGLLPGEPGGVEIVAIEPDQPPFDYATGVAAPVEARPLAAPAVPVGAVVAGAAAGGERSSGAPAADGRGASTVASAEAGTAFEDDPAGPTPGTDPGDTRPAGAVAAPAAWIPAVVAETGAAAGADEPAGAAPDGATESSGIPADAGGDAPADGLAPAAGEATGAQPPVGTTSATDERQPAYEPGVVREARAGAAGEVSSTPSVAAGETTPAAPAEPAEVAPQPAFDPQTVRQVQAEADGGAAGPGEISAASVGETTAATDWAPTDGIATADTAPDGADATTETARTRTAIPDGMTYVQAGYFTVPEHAADLVRTLFTFGIPSRNLATTVQGRPMHRVVAGPFDSVEARARALDRLRAIGVGDARPIAG